MFVASSVSKKKSWQTGRERVSVLAALAIHKETVMRVLARVRDENRDPEHPDKPLAMDAGGQVPPDSAASEPSVSARHLLGLNENDPAQWPGRS